MRPFLPILSVLSLLPLSAQAVTVMVNPDADAYIRNGANSNTNFDTGELLVGRVSGGDWIRSVLQFDLSSIPDGATINSVTFSIAIGSQDAGTAGASTNSLGAPGVRLVEMTADAEFDSGDNSADFTWNDQSWGADNANGGADDVAWTAAGGDISGELSSIANNVIPIKTVTAGTFYTFDTTAAFESAIAANLADDSIQLVIQTPGIETGFNERKLIRFDSSTGTNAPVLTIDYTPIPEPSAGMLALLALGGVLVRRRR